MAFSKKQNIGFYTITYRGIPLMDGGRRVDWADLTVPSVALGSVSPSGLPTTLIRASVPSVLGSVARAASSRLVAFVNSHAFPSSLSK